MSGRYEIRSKIGQGGVGEVYKAFDTKLQRNVALKRLLPLKDSKDNEEAASALKKEASIISSLQNPNVVTVFDAGTDEKGAFVVMELIQGQTLDKIVKRAALQQDDFVSVVEQSLGGLIGAQDVGLLHRDLKPKNIMICWLPSGSFQLKILDFGLAKFSARPSLQTVDHGDSILGSVHFMAPEQFERKHLDPRTDLYAMGCVYYFALAQKFPFRGETPAEVMSSHLNHFVRPIEKIRKDINPGYCQWIMRLVSRNPDDRPSDARVALEEFQAIATVPPGTLLQPDTAAPIGLTIPQLELSTTTSFVTPTGPVSAATGSTPISSRVHTITAAHAVSNRRTILLFGALAVVAVVGLLAVASFSSRSGSTPDPASRIPPLPMSAHRVAHFAADLGVFTGDGSVKAVKRDRVSAWRDVARDISGDNVLEQLSESDDRKPSYETAGKTTGLNGTHAVIRFHKGASLTATRAEGVGGDGFDSAFDGNQLAYFIVFKPAPQAKDHGVLSFDQKGNPNSCVTWYRQRAYKSGARRKGVPDRLSSVPCNLGSFILLTFVWDGMKKEQFQDVTFRGDSQSPGGTRIPGPLETVDFDGGEILRFRLGATREGKANQNLQLAGDVAELIVYNTALSTRDIKAIETYLYKKYFDL